MAVTYKGNIYINGNTIVLVIAAALYLWLLIFIRTALVSFIIFSSAWLYIFIKQSFQVYYFVLDDEAIIIKNHYLPWIMKTIPFEKINDVSFERRFNMAYSLKVNSQDESNHYSASTLSSGDWKALQTALEKLNITVRNTII